MFSVHIFACDHSMLALAPSSALRLFAAAGPPLAAPSVGLWLLRSLFFYFFHGDSVRGLCFAGFPPSSEVHAALQKKK